MLAYGPYGITSNNKLGVFFFFLIPKCYSITRVN